MHLAKSNQESLDILDQFIANNIRYYSSKRNFDFGPDNRSNVSLISPYISHRIFTEYQVIKRVLRKKSYQSVEKFIQEVFWRLYWRGWLSEDKSPDSSDGDDDLMSKLNELDDPENKPKKKEEKSDDEEDKSGMDDLLGKLDEL